MKKKRIMQKREVDNNGKRKKGKQTMMEKKGNIE